MFTNEHFKGTFVERLSGESPNDRNDRAIRVAAKWCGPRPAGMLHVYFTPCMRTCMHAYAVAHGGSAVSNNQSVS